MDALEEVEGREDKEIRVEVGEKEEGGKRYVEVEVRDNGVGIGKDEMVEIYGGDVEVESEVGKGAVFRVRLAVG